MKKILSTIVILSLFVMTSAFAIDCYVQLTYDVNDALDQYERDLEVCHNTIVFRTFCLQEAEASKDFSIDAALDVFDRCCCLNNQPCCG